MSAIELIIFDMDGTLYPYKNGMLSFHERQSYMELHNKGVDFLADKLNITREEAILFFEEYGARASELITNVEKKLGLNRYEFTGRAWDIDACLYIDADPRLRNMLEKLDSEKALLTNSPLTWTERVLRRLNVLDMFYVWTGESEVRKPCKEAYLQVTDYFGIAPKKTMMIDDELRFLLPAKKLGMLTVLIDDKPEDKADFTIPSIYELPKLLNLG